MVEQQKVEQCECNKRMKIENKCKENLNITMNLFK